MLLSSSARILFPIPSYPWTLALTGSRYKVSLELPRSSLWGICPQQEWIMLDSCLWQSLSLRAVPSSPKISPKFLSMGKSLLVALVPYLIKYELPPLHGQMSLRPTSPVHLFVVFILTGLRLVILHWLVGYLMLLWGYILYIFCCI